MDPCVPSEKKSDSDVNGTVVVNMLTLEVAVEDVDTAGEKAGLTTAHETLLIHAGWKRHHCFGAAVQKDQFRVVSGFINGLREGVHDCHRPGVRRSTQCLRTAPD